MRKHRKKGRQKPVLMVSSTVYGIRNLLNQLHGYLQSVGWEVWISDRGSVPVDSDHSALDNCLRAVEDCDAFLGIITGRYGSGRDSDGVSFTHREMEVAIKLKLKRWFLVQHEVVVSRSLCLSLAKVEPRLRRAVEAGEAHNTSKGAEPGLKRNPYLNCWRILDMYDLAIRDGCGALEDRAGNWVQPYRTDDEAMLYAQNQLSKPHLLFPQYAAASR